MGVYYRTRTSICWVLWYQPAESQRAEPLCLLNHRHSQFMFISQLAERKWYQPISCISLLYFKIFADHEFGIECDLVTKLMGLFAIIIYENRAVATGGRHLGQRLLKWHEQKSEGITYVSYKSPFAPSIPPQILDPGDGPV